MASYHFSKKISTQTNASANMRADYIKREGIYSTGTKAEELLYKDDGNMPEWAKENPRNFWKASEDYDGAKGRVSFHEIEFALPNELDFQCQKELVKEFIDTHLGKDFVYSFAIHEKAATLAYGIQNPHAHIMFSDRKLDGINRDRRTFFKRADKKVPERGGALKDERWRGSNRKGYLQFMREDCANLQNKYLEREGFSERVDHRNKDLQYFDAIKQGDIDKAELLQYPAEKHLGPKIASKVARDLNILTAGISDVKERNKIRALYWQANKDAYKLKATFMLDSRKLKESVMQEQKEDNNKRVIYRERYTRDVAENMFWKAKKRELKIMRSNLNLEKSRLERAEANNVRNLKVEYWRKHYNKRVAACEVLKNKIDNKYLTQKDLKEIENIQYGIISVDQKQLLVNGELSQDSILRKLYPDVSLELLNQMANQRIPEINKEIASLKKEERRLSKKFRTDFQIRAVAEWRASNGLLASIRRDEKKLLDEKRKYKIDLAIFKEKTIPSAADQAEFAKYTKENAKLEEWKKGINSLSDSISSRHAGWEVLKKKPEFQSKILKLQNKLLARNDQIKNRLITIQDEKAKLYQERSEWRQLKYSMSKPRESGNYLQTRSVIGQLQKVMRNLREEKVKGRLRNLKLREKDDEDELSSDSNEK